MKVFATSAKTLEYVRDISESKWDGVQCSKLYMGKEVDPYSGSIYAQGPYIQIRDRIYYFWSEDYDVTGGEITILEIRYHTVGKEKSSIKDECSFPELSALMGGGVKFSILELAGQPYPSDDPDDIIIFDYGFLLEKINVSFLVWSETGTTSAWTLSGKEIERHISSITSIRNIVF